jgi:hypothetical protein
MTAGLMGTAPRDDIATTAHDLGSMRLRGPGKRIRDKALTDQTRMRCLREPRDLVSMADVPLSAR